MKADNSISIRGEEVNKKEPQLKGNKEKEEGKKRRGRWYTNNMRI